MYIKENIKIGNPQTIHIHRTQTYKTI